MHGRSGWSFASSLVAWAEGWGFAFALPFAFDFCRTASWWFVARTCAFTWAHTLALDGNAWLIIPGGCFASAGAFAFGGTLSWIWDVGLFAAVSGTFLGARGFVVLRRDAGHSTGAWTKVTVVVVVVIIICKSH